MPRIFFPMLVILILGIPSTGSWAQSAHVGSSPWAEDVLKIKSGKISDSARVFLVAGSSLVANFAQEIVDQRRIWLEKGLSPEEVACYFVLPTQEEFEEEREKYQALAPDLKECFPASVKQLRDDLKKIAKKNPPYLYLYVTSHGRQPISEKIRVLKRQDPNFYQLRYLARFSVLDQYSLDIEGLPDGSAGPYELLGAYRGGMDPEDIFFTPRYLFKFMQKEFSNTPKYLVLQGCFSGGFLVDPRKEQWDTLLTRLKNAMVMTAARHNRESFGCDPGDRTTYYGEVFNGTLKRMGNTPPAIDWKSFYSALKQGVTALETKMEVENPSDPAFFSSQGGAEEFL